MNEDIIRTLELLWKQYDSIKDAKNLMWINLCLLEKQLQREEE